MAKRKDTSKTAASPDGASEQTPASEAKIKTKIETKSELPAIESPSISPAGDTPAIIPDKPEPAIEAAAIAPEAATADARAASRLAFKFTARGKRQVKRYASLTATVALAAGIGAAIGALSTGGITPPPSNNTAALDGRDAMQQSISRLTKEIGTLKANIADANKAAHSQIAKINDRITDRLEQKPSVETTGTIPAPISAPLPPPRPAAVETVALARPPVVKDWWIRDARGGFVYVQGHGEIYQVVTGAPLPGLGPVRSIKRQDGRWVVETPKGLIVSMRDRHYFEF